MERLEAAKINSADKAKSLKVDVVRHAPSTYRQPEWRDIETADDINTIGRYEDGEKTPEEIARGKAEAESIVRDTATKIAEDIEPDEEVVIWSSPTGRTLETARIIREVLVEKGIKSKNVGPSDERGVKIFEKLGEVKNFKWELFEPLMNGGEVDHNGTKFIIDKSLSNPQKLGYPDYFTSDAIKEISAEAKKQWPAGYVKEIESFESFKEVSGRMADALGKLKQLSDKNYRVIIVTHDALTGDIVKTFTNDQLSGIEPGRSISLERVDDKLVVKRVGDVINGNDKVDVASRRK
jgi:broad specificity phosphatase PhoE